MARSEAISGFWLGEKLSARVEAIREMGDRLQGGVIHEVRVYRQPDGWAEFQVLLGRVDDIGMHLAITAREGDGPSEWRELDSSDQRQLGFPPSDN
jgi:hypothetical protein